MEMRNLGRSGLRVSAVGLGCNNFGWRIGPDESRAVIDAAIDAGITLFDTANTYGDSGGLEEILGRVLGRRRKDIVLATKVGMRMADGSEGASRANILRSVEDSLRRLQTDWIDLYQIHQPDPLTPIDETLRALDDLIRAGKVRYIGSSQFAGWQVTEADHVARALGTHRFISTQNALNLLARRAERELLPAAETYGIGFLPFFPLASGMLTGKYTRDRDAARDTRFAGIPRLAAMYATDRNWERVEELRAFCGARGRRMVDLAFSWLLHRPSVASVIAGATRPDQVQANVAAAAGGLSAGHLAEIDAITDPEAP